MIFYQHKRVDGRKIDEIRPLSCEIDLLPRVHGSALFTRGQTQVLSVATLGMESEEQELDGIDTETSKCNIYTKEKLDMLPFLRTDTDVELFIGMDEIMQKTYAQLIATKINENEKIDLNKIEYIKTKTGIDIKELAESLKNN